MLDKLNPVQIFTNNRQAAWFWFVVALLAFAALTVMPYLLVVAWRTQEKVVILNSATGSMVYAPVQGFMRADELHAYHAKLATLAMLQLNPSGPDFPELVDRLFMEATRNRLHKEFADNEAVFRAKQLRQKVEVSEIAILSNSAPIDGLDCAIVRVSGQVIRYGVSNGIAFIEPANFVVHYRLAHNPDLLNNNLFPLCVYKFDYAEK